jgi:SnoaL-like domain
MDPAAVQRWIEVWARGWAEHDVDAIASLYADGAGHRSEPFRERGNLRDYAAWAFSDEQHAEVWFAEARVVGDAGAACEWWAVSTQTDGTVVTIAGVSLLHFRPDGLCDDQRDYWSQVDGAHAPPADFGPVALHLEQPA